MDPVDQLVSSIPEVMEVEVTKISPEPGDFILLKLSTHLGETAKSMKAWIKELGRRFPEVIFLIVHPGLTFEEVSPELAKKALRRVFETLVGNDEAS